MLPVTDEKPNNPLICSNETCVYYDKIFEQLEMVNYITPLKNVYDVYFLDKNGRS